MATPVYTEAAFWRDGKLVLNQEETDDIQGRRWRAKEVLEKYRSESLEDGVLFNDNLRVVLLPDRVGCVCQDMRNRRLPCKHVFAAAALMGDASALLTTQPAVARSATKRSADAPHKSRSRQRPQDIQVGNYFLLSDFLWSDTAAKEGIRNWFEPDSEYGQAVLECMSLLCSRLLDPLCDEFGRISITRGYLGQELYARLYPKDKDNWQKGALAHGFQVEGGADIRIHTWDGSALELAKAIQAQPDRYTFSFIRVYPASPILCVGVGRFKNSRVIQEWQNNFAGSITHRPIN